MQKQNRARIMNILAMGIFGTIGLFVRNIGVSSGELALYRAMLATVLIGLFLLVTRQKIPFRQIRKAVPLLLISGCAMGFNWILLFQAYKYTTVSVATLSYYFAPVLVTLACPVLFREKLGPRQWLCFGMSTLGILLITGLGDLHSGSNHLVGILFGLGAACLYASVILLNKFIRDVEGIHRSFLQFVAAVVVLAPYVACTSGVTLAVLDTKGWIYLLVVGLVHTGIAYCLYFPSLKELPGQNAAILSYIDPLVAVVLSVTVLDESMTPTQILGGLLILGFTLWNELAPTGKPDVQQPCVKNTNDHAVSVGIIGGADGPTSIFVSDTPAKLPLRARVKRYRYQRRRKRAEQQIVPGSHSLEELIDYAITTYGLTPAAPNPEYLPPASRIYVLEKGGNHFSMEIDDARGSFGVSFSGKKTELKSFRRIAKDLYRYYGVSEEDIRCKTLRYYHLLGILSS